MRKYLDKIMKLLTAGTLLIMLLLVVWQVFTRYILKNPSTWSEELVGYLFASSTLFGASLIVSERGHMNIPVLIDTRSVGVQKNASIFSEIVIFLFSLIVLTYGGIRITSLALNQMTSSLGVAIGLFYIPLPISGIINMIFCLMNISDILKGKVKFIKASSATEISERIANEASEVLKYDDTVDLDDVVEDQIDIVEEEIVIESDLNKGE